MLVLQKYCIELGDGSTAFKSMSVTETAKQAVPLPGRTGQETLDLPIRMGPQKWINS